MRYRLPPSIAAFSNRLIGTSWKRLVGLLVLLVEELTVGLLADGLSWLGRWVVALGERPMGTFFAVVLVVLVLGIAWAATDPVRVVERLRRKPRVRHTPEEVRAIDDLRAVWNNHGKSATESLALLLDGRSRTLRDYVGFARLLDRVVNQLNSYKDGLTRTFADDDPEPLHEVMSRFASFTQVYWIAAAWTNRCTVEWPSCREGEFSSYDNWLSENKNFHDALEKEKGRKLFKGRLTASLNEDGTDYRMDWEKTFSSFGRQALPFVSHVERIKRLEAQLGRVTGPNGEALLIASVQGESSTLDGVEPTSAEPAT
jgi:hypothetical protein